MPFKMSLNSSLKMSHAAKRFITALNYTLPKTRNYCDKSCKPSKSCLKIKKIQQKYGEDDGCPIHLKSGIKDQILYRSTWGLTLLGMGLSVYSLLKLVLET